MYLAGSEWHWQSIDDKVVCPLSAGKDIRKELIEKYDLCLTGEVRLTCEPLILLYLP